MKVINRKKKIVRNCAAIFILALLIFNYTGLYLTPLSAHKFSEKSIHYGPSEIKHIEKFDKGIYLLCKYDKWVSCNTVDKSFLFFWRIGSQVTGFEYNKSQAVDYTWGSSGKYYKLYGIANDPRVKKIEVILNNGDVLTQTSFYDELFLVTWNGQSYPKIVNAYDINNKIIFNKQGV